VQRLLQAKPDDLEAKGGTTATARFAHDLSRILVHPKSPVKIQAKLTVNTPGDMYEQEADRVSDQAMRMSEPQLQRDCPCGGGCPKCQTEQPGQEHAHLQTKRVGSSDLEQTPVPPIVHEVLRSPGQPLDPATRTFMESRFGHDSSRVRLYTDAKSAESVRSVNALAYTVGQAVAFAADPYAPASSESRRLLAHELVHVVQQGGATPLCHRPFKRACHETVAQESTPPLRRGEHSTRLQRQPKPHVIGDDLWGDKKDIPKALHPTTADDEFTLAVIHLELTLAVRIRHDFQTALGVTEGSRRLHKTVTWESDFVKEHGPGQPTFAELAEEHKKLESDAVSRIASLKSTELAKFLSARIGLLFPDIGFSSNTGRALRRLRGPKSVLDKFSSFGFPGADLVRLLSKPAPPFAYYW